MVGICAKCGQQTRETHSNRMMCVSCGHSAAVDPVDDEPGFQPEVKVFETGAVRSADREGQRYDLISPIGLRRLAETCAEGAVKYGDFNWERGMPISEMLNHGIAHCYAYLSGDRSEDHLAHAAWNLMGAMHSEELWPELNRLLREPGCAPPATAFLNVSANGRTSNQT